MRLGIVGSRKYKDKQRIRYYVAQLPKDTIVISGGAPGVDKLAAAFAKSCGLTVVEHIADWDKHGKRAGFIRNDLIVRDADCIVAFWDGSSTGTLDTIQKAIKAGKVVKIYPDRV